MKLNFGTLWRFSGTINRGTYAAVGLFAFAIKHNLDCLVAYGFHRPWGLFNYLEAASDVTRITELHGQEARFLATMVALALPFIWIGVAMTMQRLRSAGLPAQLAVLFFVPFVNLAFFLFLCVLPAREHAEDAQKAPKESWLSRIVPESALGSAAISLLVTVPVGFGLAYLGARVLTNYGWGLFVALPFAMGFAAALIYGVRGTRSLKGCIWVACLSVLLLGAACLALVFEGAICLMMAAPIALPLAAFGGSCAYGLQRRRPFQNDATALLSALLLFVPGLQGVEHWVAAPPPVFVVRSAIEIHASPERVWKSVVAFSQIPPPKEWIFRAGIAYPIRAEIIGSGVGAQRHCVFSTGAFVEPIEVWDEPRRLKFSVTSNPPPMEEWTPYSRADPPHLHGFLVSEGGQFLLTPLPGGGTRLEGTTWYRHGLWPAQYWRLWSDAIIHRIHMRVLRHIRDEAEDPAEAPSF